MLSPGASLQTYPYQTQNPMPRMRRGPKGSRRNPTGLGGDKKSNSTPTLAIHSGTRPNAPKPVGRHPPVCGVKEGWGWLPRATASGQGVCGKLGLGDSVCGLLGASVSVPQGGDPRRGGPGGRSRRLLEASHALRAPWSRLRRCWPSSGACGRARLQGQRDALPQALSAPGAGPGHSLKHTQPAQARGMPQAPQGLLPGPVAALTPHHWAGTREMVTGGVR